MNMTIVDVVARAILSALEVSWFSEYEAWAKSWLDGSDQSRESAHLAVARVRQWVHFGGDSWATRCCWNAAAAAEELARGHDNCATSSAEAAIRQAGYVRNPPPERDTPDREPKLVLDDWNSGPGGVRRGRSYDAGEV
jgi:hypothetical protein